MYGKDKNARRIELVFSHSLDRGTHGTVYEAFDPNSEVSRDLRSAPSTFSFVLDVDIHTLPSKKP